MRQFGGSKSCFKYIIDSKDDYKLLKLKLSLSVINSVYFTNELKWLS